ncbi:MAG: flagellar protein FlgN [Bdellovibrionales bacterium]|nr:flagellar protein FlgN [Bdellovibrionales bacterium]
MKEQLYQDLVKSLNQLVWVYRHLLDTVRKERDILTNAYIDEMADINQSKEKMLEKVRELEVQWSSIAIDLYSVMNIDIGEGPRLSELAKYFKGAERQKLEQIRSVLNLLVTRTIEVNKYNDRMIQSALAHISGAMQAVRDTLSSKSPYAKQGKRTEPTNETAGRLMSKEV